MIKPLKNENVLISGASIAGPALAYWLQKYGFTVTVIEKAPTLRTGGYKVDIRGKCVAVLKAMGLYQKVYQARVETKTATFVDDSGNIVIEMPANDLGMREKEDVEILRGDLSNILFDVTQDNCEYIFDDSIKLIKQTGQGVEVDFIKSPSKNFDLLIAADGIHSNVRSLILGDESNFLYDFGGYYYAIYTAPNYMKLGSQELFYSKNNKQINLSSTDEKEDIKIIYIFRNQGWNFNYLDIQQQKNMLADTYADAKWEVPTLLKKMDDASDFYCDAIKQIRMNKWSENRVALVGDAAYSPALSSGQGSSMAIVGAYILAGELFAFKGDHKQAFAEYEKKMKNYVITNQKLGETVIDFILPKPKSWLHSFIIKIQSFFQPKNYAIQKLKREFHHASNCIQLQDYVAQKKVQSDYEHS